MATTYDPTNLDEDDAIGRRNIVRLLLQDTGTPWVFQDEEVDYFVTANGNSVYDAAISAARSALSKYAAGSQSKTIGDLSVTNSQARASEWRALIKQLQAAKTAVQPALVPLLGNDPGQKPNFATGMHDNPRDATGSYSGADNPAGTQ